MENFNKVVELANEFLDEVVADKAKPTKANSKRMRNKLQEIKSLVTEAKRDLMERDKS